MDKLIREDYVLGNKKIVVGDNLHDLVLENLGKIWVRYGNGYKEFSQFVSTLAKATTSISKVVIEPNGLQPPESYKSGQLVFDARKKNLYLKYDESLLLLLEYNDDIIEKYVAKAGDTMTGMLTIEVQGGPPLKVNSAELVKNLNANYLEGKKADDFAQKAKDEEITGNWTFQGNDNHNGLNTFNNKVIINGELEENSTSKFAGKATFNNEIEVARTATFKQAGGTAVRVGTGDIVTDGSIGSSQFMSGMTGYGWRLDASSNTLTIDNLIVRGVLNVFELVVNKISATNGSLWITDSFKIDKVYEIEYLNRDLLTVSDSESYSNLINKFAEGKYFVIYGNDYNKYTIAPNLETHPFATRDNQSPIVETNTFDKFKRLFKINNLEQFKNELNPIVIEDIEETVDIDMLFSEFVNNLPTLCRMQVYYSDDVLILTNVGETQQITNLSRVTNDEYQKGYLCLDQDKNIYAVLLDDFADFSDQHPGLERVTPEFVQSYGETRVTFKEDRITPGSTTYKDLTILTDEKLISLHNNEIITLANMFQRNPERINDMEELDVNHLINPWAQTDFEDCVFTIVDANKATLENGIYLYNSDALSTINLYCKYFGATLGSSTVGDSNMRTWVLECDHNEFPVFKPGDILKCQKFDGNNVKQYYALVLGLADSYSYIVQLQNYSVVQEGSILEYDSDGNLVESRANLDTTLYERSLGLNNDLSDYLIQAQNILYHYAEALDSQTSDAIHWAIQVLIQPTDVEYYENLLPENPTQQQVSEWVNTILLNQAPMPSYEDCQEHPIFKKAFQKSVLNAPEKDDALVRIGSIFFSDRRNSMYLTSSEQNSPYTDVLVGVNRPDYTVVYLTPKYVKFEASQNFGDGYRKGCYYLQEDTFGEIISRGNNNGVLSSEEQAIYNKYAQFAIEVQRPQEEGLTTDVRNVSLTLLPNNDTAYKNGHPLTQEVDGDILYVSTNINDTIIDDSFSPEQVGSDTYDIDDEHTITLFIGENG